MTTEGSHGPADSGPPPVGLVRLNAVTLAWVLATLLLILYSVLFKPVQMIRTVEDRRHAVEVGLEKPDETAASRHGQTFFRLILQHFVFVAVIVAVLTIVGGVLGSSLGLPGLFRDPPERDLREERQRRKDKEYLRSRGGATAFWGAFGATFLIAMVWTAVFYTEIFEHRELFDSSHYLQEAFRRHDDLLLFLRVTATPFLGLLLLAEWFHAPAPGMERNGRERVREFVHAIAGALVAVTMIIVLARFGALAHRHTEWFVRRLYGLLEYLPFSVFSIDELYRTNFDQRAKISLLTSFAQFVLITGLGMVFFAVVFHRNLSPGLAICMLLAFGVLFSSLLWWLSTAGQAILLLGLLAVLVWTNGDHYKYRFPGMARYYEKAYRVKVGDLQTIFGHTAKEIGLLDNQQVLDRWRDRTGYEKPRLILVATTGGAYRASFWTTVVLEELHLSLGPDFYRHIRLFTGASGGMVGAGYFVAAMKEDGPPAEGFTELLRRESGLDSLTPVVRRLLLGDLPGTLRPSCQQHDRGIELEKQWRTLGTTFKDLGEGEKAGWRPSLIVSPMVVESGRRLLISNLDLGRLAETRPLEPLRLTDQEGIAAEVARLYSRSAVEFFRVFPEALPTFSLQTAVRMSATFPLASPAVSLPMEPPRRVVDAGYYDNYGVDLATSWIYVHQNWIRKNTSGLALIQIRAYPSEKEVLSYFGAEAGDRDRIAWLRDRVVASFQGLTSPLTGGLSAREWSMRFRNATQVSILDDLLNGSSNQGFFKTFVFENFTDFAMNWFLSDDDIDGMRRSIREMYPAHEKGGHDVEASDAGGAGTRSNSVRARKARDVCYDENLKQKKELKAWFERGQTT